MKTQFTSVESLAQNIMLQESIKKDYLTSVSQLTVVENHLSVLQIGDFSISPLAHQQLATYTDIPKRYYDKLRLKDPGLWKTNVNRWLREQSSDKRMLRTFISYPYELRAFLSPRYKRLDNFQVFSSIFPILAEYKDMQVVSSAITENKFYLKVVFPSLESEIKVGDVVQQGLVISNSEVGLGPMEIEQFAYRLICLNGMKLPVKGFRKHHLGKRMRLEEDFMELSSIDWEQDTLEADDKAFVLKLRDMVKTLLKPESFQSSVERMKQAANTPLLAHPIAAVQELPRVLGMQFSAGEMERIIGNLISDRDYTAWGLANAITKTANDHHDYDRASELEEIGGTIINLLKSKWNQLVEAK